MEEYRRLAILELLQGQSLDGVPHEILVDELERLVVPGTEEQIIDDLAYLKRAGAIATDELRHGKSTLQSHRLLPVGEEHLKRKRTLSGVARARWKKV